MAWNFSHLQSWPVASTERRDWRDQIAELASTWLDSPGTHPEKSGVINFSTPEGEVVAARRVVATTLHGLSIPQHISELIFVESDELSSISISSRDFPLVSDLSDTLPLLDEFDSQFFSAIGEKLLWEFDGEALKNLSVKEIIEALEDSNRQRWLAIVGPTLEEAGKNLTSDQLTAGLGVFCQILPIDGETLLELNDELGFAFSIPREGIRVFAPGFNLENDLDSRNHPALPTINWNRDIDEIDLGHPTIRNAAARCIEIAKEPSLRLVAQSVFEEVARQFASLEGIKIRETNAELVGRDTVEIDTLFARIEELTSELMFANEYASFWESEHALLDASLSDTHADLFVTNGLLEDERRSTAYLRKRLAAAGDFDPGVGPEKDFWSDVPNSFVELIARCNEVPFVRFTGSDDPYRQLDNQPRMEVCVSRAWDALHGLSDYARQKNEEKFSGGLYEYMHTGVHNGHKIGPNALAMSESEQVNVNPSFRTSRTFPVPDDVGGGGEVFMEAHVKLVTGSKNSPRMHFFDNTGGDGLIYVGYIGKHLPTPGTN